MTANAPPDLPTETDRIAVIADIHGNAAALSAVLDHIDAQGIGALVNLGDHFSGPLDAAGTWALLAARDIPAVRGNHDRYLITQTPDQMGASDRVAHDQLPPAALNWLRALPTTLRLPGMLACHATPESDDTYLSEAVTPDGLVYQRPEADIAALTAAARDVPLILYAHTHLPRVIRLNDGRRLVNPGSVGVPAYSDTQPYPHRVRTGTPDAAYAVLTRWRGDWQVTHHHVPYDATDMIARAEAANRPDWATALATGWL